MTHSAALPFTIRRSTDVIGRKEITSTHENVDGLLRLDGDRLIVQWRTSRAIDRVGKEIRTDREVEPVRELVLPLSALAGATVRWSWRRWPPGWTLVLTASDLVAFDELAGKDGLRLTHPAQLEIRIARAARDPALEFASEVELALADRALGNAERGELRGASSDPRVIGPTRRP